MPQFNRGLAPSFNMARVVVSQSRLFGEGLYPAAEQENETHRLMGVGHFATVIVILYVIITQIPKRNNYFIQTICNILYKIASSAANSFL